MFSRLTKYFIILLIAIIFGCKSGPHDYLDRYSKQNRKDVVNIMTNTKDDKKAEESLIKKQESLAPIPQISNMLSFPKPPKFTQGNQIISFSVTDAIELKDVLVELGRVTGLDVDIDPEISGGVILNAKNRPLIEVIDRIAKLGNIRYSFENDVLTFKSDTPYSKHYVVDYLVDGTLWDDVIDTLSEVIKNNSDADSQINANKSAGIITVFANGSGQKVAKSYLDEVRKTASAQVLIEAKVVEVTLNDKYEAGINWAFITGSDGNTNIKSAPTPGTSSTNPLNISLGISRILGGDTNAIDISALEEFGNVRAISSPRINSLNNQKATLNFLDKLIYFTIETESNTTNATVSNTINTITATRNEEPVGVELEITPSIDVDNKEITLFVKPTISIKSDDILDPSVDKDGNSLGNKVPVIQTRELQTTMKIKSGDTMVIGGLMKEDANNTDTGIPFLSGIPFFGNLFKFVSKDVSTVETVIFIKATIVNSSDGVSKYDREINNEFTSSKRPF